MEVQEMRSKLVLALLQLQEYSDNLLVYPVKTLGAGCPAFHINQVLIDLGYKEGDL